MPIHTTTTPIAHLHIAMVMGIIVPTITQIALIPPSGTPPLIMIMTTAMVNPYIAGTTNYKILNRL